MAMAMAMGMTDPDVSLAPDVYFKQEAGLAAPRAPPEPLHLREPLPAPPPQPQPPVPACDACAWAHSAGLRARYRPEHERLWPGRVLPAGPGHPSPTHDAAATAVDAADVAAALAEDEETDEADKEEEEEEEEEIEEDDLWAELLGPTPPRVRADTSAGAAVRGVQCASLNRLVEALAPASGAPDPQLCAVLEATYPRFTSTHALLRRLLRRYCVPSAAEQALLAVAAAAAAAPSTGGRTGVSPAAQAARLRRRACTFQNLHTDLFDDGSGSGDEDGGEDDAAAALARLYGPEDGAPAVSPAEESVVQAGVVRAVARLVAARPRDLAPRDARLVAVLARDALQRGLRAPVGVLVAAGSAQTHALAHRAHEPAVEPLRTLALPVRFAELTGATLRRLAEQFCIIDHELHGRVDPLELVCPRSCAGGSWGGNYETVPGLPAMVRRFNAVSSWTTSLLLNRAMPRYTGDGTEGGQEEQRQQKPPKPMSAETLARVAELLLKLATLLRDANDFLGMHAVVTGLSKRCVAATLDAAFAKRPEHHTRLARLRALMADGRQAATMRTCVPPCVPFVGTYQSDLERIDASMPDYTDSDRRLVNVAKCTLIHRTVTEMLRGQDTPYPYTVEPSLRFYAQMLPESLSEAQIDAL